VCMHCRQVSTQRRAAVAMSRSSGARSRDVCRVQTGYDIVIADQVSVVIPVLHWWTRSKVLFYCHFPDVLLATRKSKIKQLYS
jgi:hypothetical protein